MQKQWLVTGIMLFLVLFAGCKAAVSTQQATTTSIAPPPKVAPIEAKPHWFACEKSSDCAVEPGPCGTSEAVHQDFLEPFRAYREELNQSVECSSSAKSTKQAEAVCVNKRCNVRP